MIIYKTTNLLNGKIYIGQDSHENPRYLGSGKYILNAIKKYGKENFIKEIVDSAKSAKELNEKEKHWINLYNCKAPNGYNITDGGPFGIKMYGELNPSKRLDVKKKMSDKRKGAKNPRFGKVLSDKEKNIISIKTKEAMDLEVREKIRRSREGKTWEEIYGEEEAKKMREIWAERMRERNKIKFGGMS